MNILLVILVVLLVIIVTIGLLALLLWLFRPRDEVTPATEAAPTAAHKPEAAPIKAQPAVAEDASPEPTPAVAEVPEPPAPAAEPPPAPEPVVPQEPDELKRIEGIGPKIAAMLNQAGITTFAELAATEVSQLQAILDQANLRIAVPDTWPEQAALAAAGDWDELEKLQDELKGGRRA